MNGATIHVLILFHTLFYDVLRPSWRIKCHETTWSLEIVRYRRNMMFWALRILDQYLCLVYEILNDLTSITWIYFRLGSTIKNLENCTVPFSHTVFRQSASSVKATTHWKNCQWSVFIIRSGWRRRRLLWMIRLLLNNECWRTPNPKNKMARVVVLFWLFLVVVFFCKTTTPMIPHYFTMSLNSVFGYCFVMKCQCKLKKRIQP